MGGVRRFRQRPQYTVTHMYVHVRDLDRGMESVSSKAILRLVVRFRDKKFMVSEYKASPK